MKAWLHCCSQVISHLFLGLISVLSSMMKGSGFCRTLTGKVRGHGTLTQDLFILLGSV
jgi:hypothetical protein